MIKLLFSNNLLLKYNFIYTKFIGFTFWTILLLSLNGLRCILFPLFLKEIGEFFCEFDCLYIERFGDSYKRSYWLTSNEEFKLLFIGGVCIFGIPDSVVRRLGVVFFGDGNLVFLEDKLLFFVIYCYYIVIIFLDIIKLNLPL